MLYLKYIPLSLVSSRHLNIFQEETLLSLSFHLELPKEASPHQDSVYKNSCNSS